MRPVARAQLVREFLYVRAVVLRIPQHLEFGLPRPAAPASARKSTSGTNCAKAFFNRAFPTFKAVTDTPLASLQALENAPERRHRLTGY
jgi:hypothetical protein